MMWLNRLVCRVTDHVWKLHDSGSALDIYKCERCDTRYYVLAGDRPPGKNQEMRIIRLTPLPDVTEDAP